jgi:hypothetical protein
MSKDATQIDMGKAAGVVDPKDFVTLHAACQPLSGGADWCEHRMDDEDGEGELRLASGSTIGALRCLRDGNWAEAASTMRRAVKNIDAVDYYSLKHFYDTCDIEEARTMMVRVATQLEALAA